MFMEDQPLKERLKWLGAVLFDAAVVVGAVAIMGAVGIIYIIGFTK